MKREDIGLGAILVGSVIALLAMGAVAILDPQRIRAINSVGMWDAPLFWAWLPAMAVSSFFVFLAGLALLYSD